jgi:hypothetical protein
MVTAGWLSRRHAHDFDKVEGALDQMVNALVEKLAGRSSAPVTRDYNNLH